MLTKKYAFGKQRAAYSLIAIRKRLFLLKYGHFLRFQDACGEDAHDLCSD